MIDFATTYELAGRTEWVVLSPRSERLGVNGYAVARGEMPLPRATAFVRGNGECTADVLGTGFASLYLISVRLVERLEAEGVTGWRSEPVRFDDDTAADGGYHALSIVGRCGAIRDELSEIVKKKRPGGMTKWRRGWYFDRSTWDGSEIFTPADLGTVFVVSRVREILRSYDLNGAHLIPLPLVERLI